MLGGGWWRWRSWLRGEGLVRGWPSQWLWFREALAKWERFWWGAVKGEGNMWWSPPWVVCWGLSCSRLGKENVRWPMERGKGGWFVWESDTVGRVEVRGCEWGRWRKLWPSVCPAEEVKMKENGDGKGDQVRGWRFVWVLCGGSGLSLGKERGWTAAGWVVAAGWAEIG